MVSAARAVDGGQRTTGLGGVTRLSAKVHLNPCLFSNSSSFLTCLFFNPLRGQRWHSVGRQGQTVRNETSFGSRVRNRSMSMRAPGAAEVLCNDRGHHHTSLVVAWRICVCFCRCPVYKRSSSFVSRQTERLGQRSRAARRALSSSPGEMDSVWCSAHGGGNDGQVAGWCERARVR